jgi:hypothetical protein
LAPRISTGYPPPTQPDSGEADTNDGADNGTSFTASITNAVNSGIYIFEYVSGSSIIASYSVEIDVDRPAPKFTSSSLFAETSQHTITVSFDEDVTLFDGADLQLTDSDSTGATISSVVAISASKYIATITNAVASGMFTLRIHSSTDAKDAAGNIIDSSGPGISIIRYRTSDLLATLAVVDDGPTDSETDTFTVTFATNSGYLDASMVQFDAGTTHAVLSEIKQGNVFLK